jgi:serine/threonine-protein phosphatase 2A regulatory subunit B
MLFLDKTIKLWKLGEKKSKAKNTSFVGNGETDAPSEAPALVPDSQQKRVYANAHAYNVNSISLCSDGELFISADDLRINLWNLEISSECFSKSLVLYSLF